MSNKEEMPKLFIDLKLSRGVTQDEYADLIKCMRAFSETGKDTTLQGVEITCDFKWWGQKDY